MTITIIKTAEGTFRVSWIGPDKYFRTRMPFIHYRDAERFANQIECALLIEAMLADQGMSDEEESVH